MSNISLYTLLTPFALFILMIDLIIFLQLITFNIRMLVNPIYLFFIHVDFPWFFECWLTNYYVFSHLSAFIEASLFSFFLNDMHILIIFSYLYIWLHNWVFYHSYRLLNINHYLVFCHSTLFLFCLTDLCVRSHIKYYNII
jgi:hypothetical protein